MADPHPADEGEASALLDLAVAAARSAGEELRRRASNVTGVETKSSSTDPVTDADRAAEALLVDALLGARPDDAILGEEGADSGGASGVRWVVDPLDGTVNYLYGRVDWCVSVAAEDSDGGLVAVVYQPVTDTLYTARRGAGAWRDGEPITVNDPVEAAQALIATGFSYDAEHRRRQAAIAAALLPRVRDIRRAGSAALDLCAVACGAADGYYEDATSHWDWAAGVLVAREAGAVVTDLSGPGDRRGKIAAGRRLHPDLVDLLAAAAAGDDL